MFKVRRRAVLTAELDARVSWSNGVALQGLVRLNYLADVDPWLVHATFVVAEVREDYDIERVLIGRAVAGIGLAQWLGNEGAPVRLGSGSHFIRFRLTDTDSGNHADFDVRRPDIESFIGKTSELVDYPTEKAALAAYVENALGEL